MSSINVTNIKSRQGSAPTFPQGLNVSAGVATFAGNVSIAGTLTYDDVTNIDSVGIVTAGKGLRVTTGGAVITAGVATISGGVNVNTGNVKVAAGIVTVGAGVTISSDFIHLADNSKINVGAGSDFQIYHDGTHNYFKGSTSADTKFIQNGNFIVESSGGETIFRGLQNAGCDLWYNDTKRIETISTGASVYGALKLQNGLLRENVNRNTSAAANAATALNLDDGMVHWFTTNLGAANVKMNIVSGVGINTDMAIGDMITVTIMTKVNSSSNFIEQLRVDGVEASAGVTTYWTGGSAPSDGGDSGVDTYAFSLVKTVNAAYDMVANQVKGS